jgi:hypothetical protein
VHDFSVIKQLIGWLSDPLDYEVGTEIEDDANNRIRESALKDIGLELLLCVFGLWAMLAFQLFVGLGWKKQKRLALSVGLTLISGVLKRTPSF